MNDTLLVLIGILGAGILLGEFMRRQPRRTRAKIIWPIQTPGIVLLTTHYQLYYADTGVRSYLRSALVALETQEFSFYFVAISLTVICAYFTLLFHAIWQSIQGYRTKRRKRKDQAIELEVLRKIPELNAQQKRRIEVLKGNKRNKKQRKRDQRSPNQYSAVQKLRYELNLIIWPYHKW